MKQERIHGLDLVRAIAIGLVLLLHMTQAIDSTPLILKKFFSIGWAGVDIFFVLSGFLIGTQVYKDNVEESFSIKLNNFWVKRWFRTIPLYIAFLFIYMIIKPALMSEFNGDKWPFFFFMQNFFSPKDFVQSWSLCIEEQFYLIFPILIYGLSFLRKKIYLFAIPILISIAMRWNIIDVFSINTAREYAYFITFPAYTHMDGICMGVILAFTQHHWTKYIKNNSLIIFILGLVMLSIVLINTGTTPRGLMGTWAFTFISLASSLLVMSGLFLKINTKIIPILYWVSTLSYSAYLWNNLSMKVVEKYCNNLNWILSSFIFLALTFTLSWGTYKLIENPFIKLRKFFLRKN